MNVETLQWPDDAERLAELREARVPRLLVVADDAEVPIAPDCLEDWVGFAAKSGTPDEVRRASKRSDQQGAEQAESA